MNLKNNENKKPVQLPLLPILIGVFVLIFIWIVTVSNKQTELLKLKREQLKLQKKEKETKVTRNKVQELKKHRYDIVCKGKIHKPNEYRLVEINHKVYIFYKNTKSLKDADEINSCAIIYELDTPVPDMSKEVKN